MKKIITLSLALICVLGMVGCGKKEKHEIEILVPAGSTEAFAYSETQIRPVGNKITIWSGAGLGDTEVILQPVDENVETGYVAEYLTHGVPVEFDTINVKDKWFRIGVSVQNDSDKGPIAVSVEAEGVEVRKTEYDSAPLAPDVSDKDLESVNYIEVMSGLTGQRIKVKDADSVQKVMDDIESLKYEKKKTVEEVGYAYRIRFYNENDDILGRIYITEENGHQISYDGYYYLVGADQNINVNFLEELLKDAPPAEPGDEGNDELPDIEPVESITYNGKEYKTSELCNATLEWLELSEKDRMLSSYFPPEFMIFDEKWGVSLTVDGLTTSGAIIKCTQSGGEATGELHTGSWYILENWTQENGWKEMPYVIDGEIGWNDIAWIIPMNDTIELEVNWEWLYGKLPVGKYRIGKSITDFRESGDYDTATYFVEFEIEK